VRSLPQCRLSGDAGPDRVCSLLASIYPTFVSVRSKSVNR
jgi:hypothetical protein